MNDDTPQRQLPKYRCHKEVWALKIKSANWRRGGILLELTPEDSNFAPFTVDEAYVRRHGSGDLSGGYYVVYADGYRSWSPAKAFEEGYTLIQPTRSGAAVTTRVQVATIGRTVHYVLTEDDADKINRRRTDGQSISDRLKPIENWKVDEFPLSRWPEGAQAHIGNSVQGGMEFPAIVVRDWNSESVNLQVFLDGNDVYWATSVHQSEESFPGNWHWPELV